ncbi:MAG: arsenate reductase ArsC [Proteobacteria bacterium]|nr:arsenate reductase ArsC [Pseudomonadota bacterium]
MMAERVTNVLFLCTGNSCRSIIAEALLNDLGQGRFRAFSAGSHPAGRVNPRALRALERRGFPADGLRSKSWDEFAAEDAPVMDFIITVCDNAAGEVCPAWPGGPLGAHWGIPDPAVFSGTEEETEKVFDDVIAMLERRINALTGLPLDTLDADELHPRLGDIGTMADDQG